MRSMMPIFIAYFGSTLDELGESSTVEDLESRSVVDSVRSFIVLFGIVGVVALVSGFVLVSLWSIAGERQVMLPLIIRFATASCANIYNAKRGCFLGIWSYVMLTF